MKRKFHVFVHGDLDEKVIEAFTASMAAEAFVALRELNNVEFPVGNGTSTINIAVIDERDDVFLFIVSGYLVPEYIAEEVDKFD